MQFPKLSPLQSRFAASLTATLILVLIYLSLSQPRFAYAVELDSRIPPDHNHPILLDFEFDDDDAAGHHYDLLGDQLDRRQVAGALSLKNNEPQNKNINLGETQHWVMTKDTIDSAPGERGRGLPVEEAERIKKNTHTELKKRQSAKQIYITINTCIQPLSLINSTDLSYVVPPALLLYYSQSTSNQNPGPAGLQDLQSNITVSGGYAIVNLTTDTDVYVGVAAVNATGFVGNWNYEIAASIDAPYHSVEDNTPYLHFVDGDTHAALLITDDLTQSGSNSSVYQEWMSMPPPYGMLGHDQKDPSILGVSRSYCGLMHNAHIMANLQDVKNQNVAGMTNRGLGAKPKEQFYVTSLNASSSYWGFLAMQGNSTASGLNVIGGGGKVWAAVNFSTKAEPNCALMYNLTFCSEVAYAVPTNPDLFSPRGGLPALAKLYDDSARALYQYFNYSLQQIPCNTTPSAQYSLARNCYDCARAYKQWLCAVTIPRCEDYTNPATYLKPRNVAQPFPNGTMLDPIYRDPMLLDSVASNSSRNALIDDQIKPGPYKEVLPCEDLCYDLVQSCPAALGFGCPLRRAGLEDGYGFRTGNAGEITCSYLGAAYYLSAATRSVAGARSVISVLLALGLGMIMSV